MSAETLSIVIDATVMRQLEQLAREAGVDVSRFVEQYLAALTTIRVTEIDRNRLPPKTRQAVGLPKGAADRPYRELLEEAIWEKHGKR